MSYALVSAMLYFLLLFVLVTKYISQVWNFHTFIAFSLDVLDNQNIAKS